MSLRPAVSSLLAGLGFALALAACGGGEDGTSAAAAGSSTTAAERGFSSAPAPYFGLIKVTTPTGDTEGAQVRSMDAGSPFFASGLAPGDVITGIGGEPVASPDELGAAIGRLSEAHVAGETLQIEVSRGSRELTLDVTLAPKVYLGADVTEAKGSGGLLVRGMKPGSPADAAALQEDDVITAVDGAPVASIEDLFTALATARPGDEVELTVSRGSQELTKTVTLDTRPEI